MILPGTKIGEGAIIQGGSVVHGEIPPYAIAGGNPAKVFKYRDIEHFKKLKAEGKFKGGLQAPVDECASNPCGCKRE